MKTYKDILNEELVNRQKMNKLFSLRSFARLLDISPAQLSQVMSGKRSLTLKMANKISDKLYMDPLSKELFLDSLNNVKLKRLRLSINHKDELLLKEDEFKIISDWPHFAILSLAHLKNNNFDSRWIAKRLGIDITRAVDVRDRLVRMNLITRKGSSFTRSKVKIKTSDDVASKSIQLSHLKNLDLAKSKLEETSVELREFSTITMAINSKHLNKAKEAMRRFESEIENLLEYGKQTEVYTFAMQLYPLTK
jgi:uncharacterized protein (TIGR02147 family)